MGPISDPPKSEWREGGWQIVVSAAAGAAIASTHYYSMGAFFLPLSSEFQWTRAEISGGVGLISFGHMIGNPFFGALVDRFGARRVGICGAMLYCLGLFGLGLVGPGVWTWYMACGLMACVQGAVSFVVWTAPVARHFDRRRGIAIALVLCGTGVCGTIVPPVAEMLISGYGWRAAYFILSAGALCMALPLLLLFFGKDNSGRPRADASDKADLPGPDLPGMSLGEAVRTTRFWRLGLGAFLIAFCVSSVLVHLQPMLTDHGVSPAQAARFAALVGPALILGRLISGTLLDILHGPFVAATVFLLPIVSFVLLDEYTGDLRLALVIVLFIGMTAGSEGEIVSYLTGRFFGLRHYGVLSGVLIGMLSAGSGLAPIVAGQVYDSFGSYQPFIVVAPWLILASSIIFATLGKYKYDRYRPGKEQPALIPEAA